jgi:hypothetical protein
VLPTTDMSSILIADVYFLLTAVNVVSRNLVFFVHRLCIICSELPSYSTTDRSVRNAADPSDMTSGFSSFIPDYMGE